MKRLTVLGIPIPQSEIQSWSFLVIILVSLPALCLGQYNRSGSRSRPPRLKVVQLAEPNLTGSVSFEQALTRRQNVRQFTGQPLEPAQIGQLAWAGQGITEPIKGLRTAPSIGASYPMKLYFATQEAMFAYNPQKHTLEETFSGDVRTKLAAALKQEAVAGAGCNIIVVGSVRKVVTRYRNKARECMLLEAGHIAQNIQLQAVCLGLGSVAIGTFDTGQIRAICRLSAALEPMYIICVGYPAAEAARQKPEQQDQGGETDTTPLKRAVFIIASQNYRDEELFETKRVLDQAGVQTLIASSRVGLIRGMLGTTAQAMTTLNQLRVDDYDAIIFVGGSGAAEYFNNPVALNIARQAAQKKKVLAAICIAPTVLANAGVLKGLKATSFSSEQLKLQNAGARYTGAAVERDGLIITASDPRAASQFGRAIAAALAP